MREGERDLYIYIYRGRGGGRGRKRERERERTRRRERVSAETNTDLEQDVKPLKGMQQQVEVLVSKASYHSSLRPHTLGA